MYSKHILDILQKKNIEIGDKVKLSDPKLDNVIMGILMPRPENGDDSLIVLKLDNGYNTGFKFHEIELIEKSPKKKSIPMEARKAKKGDIVILGSGGTISSKLDPRTGAASPSIDPEELKRSFPELNKWSIHSRQLFSLPSEELNYAHWMILADEIENEIKNGASGFVIMHGTDSISYSSAAISFMLQNLPVPVIFVGSQRSSDRPSSDNKLNLLNSVFAASQNFGEVGVCMHATTNDDFCYLHRGTKVRKMHSSAREAFKSINISPLAEVDYLNNSFKKLAPFKERNTGQLVSKKNINPNVALLYMHPNLKPSLISKLSDYDGIVIAGMGLGHIASGATSNDPKVMGLLTEFKGLIDSGVSVAMSSQTIYGRVCMRVYTNGRVLIDAGFIGDGADWTPETAYVKLCWALGQTKDQKKVRELMETNIAGEITERSEIILE